VSDVVEHNASISFNVSRVGVPVVVTISYFPNWHVSGAQGVYRVSPNLMVVVPTSHHVSLSYGTTPVDYEGYLLTIGALIGLVVLVRRPQAGMASVRRAGLGRRGLGPDNGPPGPLQAAQAAVSQRAKTFWGAKEAPVWPTDAPRPDQHGLEQHGLEQHGLEQHGPEQYGAEPYGAHPHEPRHGPNGGGVASAGPEPGTEPGGWAPLDWAPQAWPTPAGHPQAGSEDVDLADGPGDKPEPD
jgi:hypothetical protein